MALLDDLWNDAVGSVDWLKQVILGEFDDHQSTSAMITQLLASFVPGVVIVMSARDLTAVLIRMVRHPEKRENLTEWMILVACAIGLVPALIGAAAGAAAAGVGAVVGGLAGDEAGAALRATALLLIEDGSRMLEKVIQFLRRFVKGDILRFLREAKFVRYAQPVAEEVGKFLGHMISITQKVIAKASEVRWIGSVGHIIDRLKVLEHGFYDLQRAAVHKIPQVMAEFDSRLQRALGEHMAQADHVVHPNTPAPHPTPKPPVPKRVAARADHPLGKPPGLEPADPLPPKTPPDKNLHPQGVEEEPSARVADSTAQAAKYPVQTERDKAYFWSGRSPREDGTFAGGAADAQVIASQSGGITLESLIEQRNIDMPAWDANNPDSVAAWKGISADYANGASGNVNAVIGSSLRPGNVWETAELPALKANPNVTSITTIDPATGVQKLLWTR
ncbi:MAG: hypothetical protein ACRYGF_13360 [Janthinobacterium lividum]